VHRQDVGVPERRGTPISRWNRPMPPAVASSGLSTFQVLTSRKATYDGGRFYL
jgi:hypothetical protein